MQMVRTTLRLKEDVKKALERKAFEDDTTLQNLFNHALEQYLEKDASNKAKKIVFKTHNFGVPLDNLTRKDYYSEPKIT